MTPQEFRQTYLEFQDSLGNHLQTLTMLSAQLTSTLAKVESDYRALNAMVDQFINEQENQDCQNYSASNDIN